MIVCLVWCACATKTTTVFVRTNGTSNRFVDVCVRVCLHHTAQIAMASSEESGLVCPFASYTWHCQR